MSVWGGLTNSCEREVKSKEEKERYKHLKAEFQRIARRVKKAFLRDQCKEIEENNRMWKTRDLFKKIRDTKETFHAKMVSIKDRNGMDLTEAEDIKKRRQEHTEELYKKILMTQITTMVWSFTWSQIEGFLISPCYSLELCIQMSISFFFSFAFHFFSQQFVWPPQTAILLFFAFIFRGDDLDPYLLYSVTYLHP